MTSSASDEVIYEVEPTGVAWLVLNRPDAGNAVTRAQRGVILDLLEQAADDHAVRAIVLTGAGERHFCTGADLRVATQGDDPAEPARVGTVMRGLESSLGAQRFVAALLDCPKPIIASVNGTAAGLDAHLLVVMDRAQDDVRPHVANDVADEFAREELGDLTETVECPGFERRAQERACGTGCCLRTRELRLHRLHCVSQYPPREGFPSATETNRAVRSLPLGDVGGGDGRSDNRNRTLSGSPLVRRL